MSSLRHEDDTLTVSRIERLIRISFSLYPDPWSFSRFCPLRQDSLPGSLELAAENDNLATFPNENIAWSRECRCCRQSLPQTPHSSLRRTVDTTDPTFW